ncbi:phosphoribosylanthranilate isomerase [Thiosulfativibrio zosterae]|uniref:N-(5'-phosphoribosyl)anthranilate isomerase n=1 Tax=Thiosulfativibrio zosterae TaxID=2675053 RepID=A0A6F8PPI7_9GAMM|nr:phosphoribosylanthranilate isomerase [Thiosulfativibrio zosterae]BBP43957.1 N-(5'-phosphoribosyl)anthranilate isomerase [Thiosulfativibrio zosterae]
MSRTRVKICGITCLEDAMAVAHAGADAIGFVFYEKSPRNVKIDQAWSILGQIPAFLTSVALFVDADAEFVQQVIDQTQIDLLQFHGDETPEYCEQFNRPYIKAIRMQAQTDLVALAKTYASARALLLDTYVKGVPGGTGESFNWDWLAHLPSDFNKPIILAGGLTPDNVQQAIAQVSPFAVDVSGGVEAAPGKKSLQKIQQFINGTF